MRNPWPPWWAAYIHAAENRVAESRHLLENVARTRLAAGSVPGAPLVHHQFDVMLVVNLAHDLPVPGNETLHAVAFAEKFIPLHRLKIDCVAFALHPVLGLATEVPSVVMQCQAIDSAQRVRPFSNNFLKKTARPTPIIDVGAGSDER